MKIFHYNPTTGKRGNLIENVKLAGWASQSIKFAAESGKIEKIECATPTGFGTNADVTIHIDAGTQQWDGNDVSYRHATNWVCFCLGEWTAGEDSFWDWVVLPPTALIKELK